MAKKEKNPEEATTKTKKPKLFKLGVQASLFVDSSTGMKIAGTQHVEFSEKAMKSEKFVNAKRNGHIVEVTADDIEEKDQVQADFEAFVALPNAAAKAAFLKKDYDLSEEEEKALDEMSEAQLVETYKTYEGI
jgi:hypothetical protein